MDVVWDTPELTLAEREGLCVMVMRRKPDDENFARCVAHVRAVASRQQVFSTLMVFPDFDGRPTASRASQHALVETLGALASQNCGTALVVTTPGRWGSIVRAFVNTVVLLARPKKPLQTHLTLASALKWLRTLPGQLPAIRDAHGLEGEFQPLL